MERIWRSSYWIEIDWILIDENIFQEDQYEFEIRNKDDMIDNLIQRIWLCNNSDKQLMKDDLKLLINIEDEYILSSTSTNDYIDSTDENYNLHCNNILELNKTLWK